MADNLANLPPLIKRMLARDFYPHPTVDPIQLIQTHISYVFLTGSYVYKVKKAVNLGFLDFTLLDRRRHFCQEEIRLNQRGAPGIYLECLPVSATQNDFCLDGPGAPVEYAVKMRQFPQERLFNNLLVSGQLADSLIERLARTLADYHAGAMSNNTIVEYGRPERVQHLINQNYLQTMRFIGGSQTPAQYQITREFTDSFIRDSGPLMEKRIQAGKIRECHGDLHLGNICWWEGKVLLFDCIEFNESFRFIDVMQDATFTAMDLDAQGRRDLSTAFINAYAERTGDWDGLPLLPLYLCRHAYVRAKVNSLLSEDAGAPPQTRKSALATAADYFRLAAQYANRTSGEIILVCGVSGSGKSTVGRTVARQKGAIHIRADAVRKHLAGIPLDIRGTNELYTAEMTQKTYSRLLDLGLMLARCGFVVILDATYSRRDLRREAIRGAQSVGVAVRLLHCVAPAELIHERLAQRRGDISDATPELIVRQHEIFEPFGPDESQYIFVIDTCHPMDLILSQIVRKSSPGPVL